MKIRVLILSIIVIFSLTLLSGCKTQADNVSYNLSQEADSFNITRQITVINCITNDVTFQMTGRMSIKADSIDNQLEVTVESKKDSYQKHFIGLADNITYVVEDKGIMNVDKYRYELNFNPKMWLPSKPKNID